MFAVIAVISFAIALILHALVKNDQYVLDFELIGFIALSLHMLGLWPAGWIRRRQ